MAHRTRYHDTTPLTILPLCAQTDEPTRADKRCGPKKRLLRTHVSRFVRLLPQQPKPSYLRWQSKLAETHFITRNDPLFSTQEGQRYPHGGGQKLMSLVYTHTHTHTHPHIHTVVDVSSTSSL